MQISTPEWPVMRGNGCCPHFVCEPNIRAEKLKIREIGLFSTEVRMDCAVWAQVRPSRSIFEGSDLNHQVRK
jgi:hypothetical protein